jgi:peptide/nickel transport system substrate-binding protein
VRRNHTVRRAPATALRAAIALTFILAACTDVQSTPTPDGSPPDGAPSPTGGATGGTVRIGIGGSADSLNPGNGVLSEAYTLYELVYDTPIGITADGEYVPELATDWSVSDDELTWTMTIVEGATFHDGEPLTAADIAFTIELYKATDGFPFLPSYAAYFDTVEAPDDTTLVLTTEEPIGNFEANMVFMYVLPQHIWEGLDDPVAFENADMIGSGPFRLTSFTRNESAQLAANTDYWGTPPNIDGVLLRTIGNADARVTALTSGELDAIA